MKTSIALRFVATLFSSATVLLASELPIATPSTLIPSEESQTISIATPAPALLGEEVFERLDLRQATAINNAATQAAEQYPIVTTNWGQTMINGVLTYAPAVYTQTFAPVPDQWAAPIAGTIGYGTLSKGKRDAVPEPTVYLIPLEMVLQTVNVIEPIQPVLQVEVIQPVTVAIVSLVNEPITSISLRPSFGTGLRPTGLLGTASIGFMNGSSGASRTLMAGFAAATAWNRTYVR